MKGKNKKFRTLNNTYYLHQPKEGKCTSIERMSNLSEVITLSEIEKDIEEITIDDILNLTFYYQY